MQFCRDELFPNIKGVREVDLDGGRDAGKCAGSFDGCQAKTLREGFEVGSAKLIFPVVDWEGQFFSLVGKDDVDRNKITTIP